MAKNPLYKKLVDLGKDRLAGYKGRMRPRHESKAVIDAIWEEIEDLLIEDTSKRVYFDNILGVIAATRDADGYSPEKALEIIENLAHLGLADGLTGENRECIS